MWTEMYITASEEQKEGPQSWPAVIIIIAVLSEIRTDGSWPDILEAGESEPNFENTTILLTLVGVSTGVQAMTAKLFFSLFADE